MTEVSEVRHFGCYGLQIKRPFFVRLSGSAVMTVDCTEYVHSVEINSALNLRHTKNRKIIGVNRTYVNKL